MVLAGSIYAAVAMERPVTGDPNLPTETASAAPAQAASAQTENVRLPEALPAPSTATRPQTSLQLLLHRTSVFLFVLISAIAGVLLVILPWTPEWTDNYLLLSFPWLRTLVSTGFFRGLCSGLGLLDIWIGFWEALHYQEHS
ncbi:MAG: hypothetical protein WBX38_04340 [Candidatus Sulfotelmatobacter sp.]